MSLWTASDAAAATGGQATADWSADGVSIDTRTLAAGDLFVALRAARDGHDFVAQALENGAAAALVERVPEGVARDAPLLIVEDVQAALEALGRAGRARTGARVVAVTGSVGKTSTKEMLAAMLATQGRTHASVASYNNHWGVPLTLARMPADTAYAVIEIGMNHPGEIAPLARMARPHVALITTVAPAHLAAFDGIGAIAREKAAVFAGLEAGGTAVFNGDLEVSGILEEAAARHGHLSFGASDGCDWRAERITVGPAQTDVSASAGGAGFVFTIGAPGRHFALNALGALAAVAGLGADHGPAARALAGWHAVSGRGAREQLDLPTGRFDLIDDAYNANPASVSAAIAVLAATQPKGRRIAILGDMKELGETGPALHAGLAELPDIDRVDLVHCVGPLMQNLHTALPAAKRGLWVETSTEMNPEGLFAAGDIVLVKGSLSMDLGRVVDAIRKIGHPARQRNE